MHQKENYAALIAQYNDPSSLMYRKLRIVDGYIKKGYSLLDIGMGIGEFINLEKDKFQEIYGFDIDKDAVEFCNKRFEAYNNIKIFSGDLNNIKSLTKSLRFDVITCLDVLEHVDEEMCINVLGIVYDLLKDDGLFIFSGPGVFEKLRINLGLSPTHKHSHSSYEWANIFRRSNFHVDTVETVEFPIINSETLRRKVHIFGKCCVIVSKRG
ncbi:class I SAM-dependent methyltransferase [Methanobacterium formicicum]|uniref:class I SAM-dependent methyltransferase n=1 Tax=Methanobacterium formicicum TaxID=2162 RepID=UPI00248F9006|nr:class I SAM-dependent methyltransferase [Methanobacterium formicicum]